MALITRWSSFSGSLIGMMVSCTGTAVLVSQASAQTQDLGRWVEPAPVDGNYLWNEETMHAIHLSSREILLRFRLMACMPRDRSSVMRLRS